MSLLHKQRLLVLLQSTKLYQSTTSIHYTILPGPIQSDLTSPYPTRHYPIEIDQYYIDFTQFLTHTQHYPFQYPPLIDSTLFPPNLLYSALNQPDCTEDYQYTLLNINTTPSLLYRAIIFYLNLPNPTQYHVTSRNST